MLLLTAELASSITDTNSDVASTAGGPQWSCVDIVLAKFSTGLTIRHLNYLAKCFSRKAFCYDILHLTTFAVSVAN